MFLRANFRKCGFPYCKELLQGMFCFKFNMQAIRNNFLASIDYKDMQRYYIYIYKYLASSHAILVHIRRVNQAEHGTLVETVRYSQVNLVGQDST